MARQKGRQRKKDPTAGGKRAVALIGDGALAPRGSISIPGLSEDRVSFLPADGEAVAAEATASGDATDTASAGVVAETEGTTGGLAAGIAVLKRGLRTLPESPGVYRMIDRKGDALYVGKASSLKRRVTSYTQVGKLPRRLQRMVAETTSLEVVTTHTEVEALLLESNLIKRLMPRYNVLLRDDKSFPYILITEDHGFPQITKHRGAHDQAGAYYGPFASAGAVNRTVTALEKAFLLRSCSDHVFASRTRPCLMHQIKRCSAPCVGRISEGDYAELVTEAKDFLAGHSSDIQAGFAAEMQAAAERLDYEAAARYRDRLKALAHVQSHQDINVEGIDDADVLVAAREGGQTCVQVFFFRAGRNFGNRAYFPQHDKQLETEEILAAFVAQFYDNKPIPKLVLLSHVLNEQNLIGEALSHAAQRRIELLVPKRGEKRKIIEAALSNAREALARRLAESSAQRRLLSGLAECLGLEQAPERVEVYDNSHIQGANPYGAMIVAGAEGFRKSAYRKFSIRGSDDRTKGKKGGRSQRDTEDVATKFGGDDYGMMREVLSRRFARAMKEDPDRSSGSWPDLVLLDGGRGQLNAAREVLADLGLEDVPLAAVAKGPERDAGRERIFLADRPPILLEPKDPVLYFIQRLRDEAHRFAIGSHRGGRAKDQLKSALDEIPGIGAKRKRALLLHFGSAKAVRQAGLADLEAVEGISTGTAKKVYDYFHGSA